jgi:hypothetical protein
VRIEKLFGQTWRLLFGAENPLHNQQVKAAKKL